MDGLFHKIIDYLNPKESIRQQIELYEFNIATLHKKILTLQDEIQVAEYKISTMRRDLHSIKEELYMKTTNLSCV